MRLNSIFLAACLILSTATLAHADFIVQISAGANTAGPTGSTTGTNGQLTARDFTSPSLLSPPSAFPPGTQVNNDDYSGPGTANPNQVALALSIFNTGSVNVNFLVQPATAVPPAGDPVGSAEYYFAVAVTNHLNANGSAPALSGLAIDALAIELLPGVSGARFDDPRDPIYGSIGPATPLQPYFPSAFPTSNMVGFGGPSAGLLAAGETNTLFFSIDIPGSSSISPPQIFTLRLNATVVPVPEPGSLTLLSFGAVGLFLGAYPWNRQAVRGPAPPANLGHENRR
jgi:hypothetical protein